MAARRVLLRALSCHAPAMAPLTRTPPGPVTRALLRAPIYLYRIGLGRLLGRRFVEVVHVGRKSGRERRTALEVIGRDENSLVVAAAWGPKSDWFRNVVANPGVKISTGSLRLVPATARVLDEGEAVDVLVEYRRRHARAARALAKTLGLALDDPERMAARVPVVRFSRV